MCPEWILDSSGVPRMGIRQPLTAAMILAQGGRGEVFKEHFSPSDLKFFVSFVHD